MKLGTWGESANSQINYQKQGKPRQMEVWKPQREVISRQCPNKSEGMGQWEEDHRVSLSTLDKRCLWKGRERRASFIKLAFNIALTSHPFILHSLSLHHTSWFSQCLPFGFPPVSVLILNCSFYPTLLIHVCIMTLTVEKLSFQDETLHNHPL